MERRGRIPVAKFRTQEAKVRSRSRVREPDYNEQDPETDLFTLLEDNIALKEENKALKLEIEEQKRSYNEQLERNNVIEEELRALKQQQAEFEEQVKSLVVKHNKSESERNALDKLNKLKAEQLNSLTNELQLLRLEQRSESRNNDDTPLIDSAALKTKIMKILPTLNRGNGNELESLVDFDASKSLSVTNELVECLVEEYSILKNQMNAVELQLYEANEKIAELIENQHHLEEENETLRNENSNLTNVAQLLTENMKESVETSKKMESALIKLKQRNDELVSKSRDLLDGQPVPSPSPTTKQANEDFEQLQEAVHNQNADHNERIVEMGVRERVSGFFSNIFKSN